MLNLMIVGKDIFKCDILQAFTQIITDFLVRTIQYIVYVFSYVA